MRFTYRAPATFKPSKIIGYGYQYNLKWSYMFKSVAIFLWCLDPLETRDSRYRPKRLHSNRRKSRLRAAGKAGDIRSPCAVALCQHGMHQTLCNGTAAPFGAADGRRDLSKMWPLGGKMHDSVSARVDCWFFEIKIRQLEVSRSSVQHAPN